MTLLSTTDKKILPNAYLDKEYVKTQSSVIIDYWVGILCRLKVYSDGKSCNTRVKAFENNVSISKSLLWSPTKKWSHGGPVIEHYSIDCIFVGGRTQERVWSSTIISETTQASMQSNSPLEASMRCLIHFWAKNEEKTCTKYNI